MDFTWFDDALSAFNQLFPPNSFFAIDYNVKALLAIILVSLVCGAVGSLVVGNRMAFFSDALAHCTFTGIGLGLLIGLLGGFLREEVFIERVIPFIMVGFGALVGLGIAFVREKTALAGDSVIGVFFAGAMGFGAMILKFLSKRTIFKPENFVFGNVGLVESYDLFILIILTVLTFFVLSILYNQMVFSSFNPSLARSRRVRIKLCNYTFIVLLALIVNLCYSTVGALLIHSMLVVPAATAANLARNMRQMFWLTTVLCWSAGLLGYWICWQASVSFQEAKDFAYGPGGTIVCLSVLFFFASMFVAGWRRRGG